MSAVRILTVTGRIKKSCTQHVKHDYLNVTYPDIPESTAAIYTVKAKNAPGPDNIQPEFLKADRIPESASAIYKIKANKHPNPTTYSSSF